MGGGTPQLAPTGHIEALDGLRGVLALTIVLLHFGLNPLMARLTGGILTWAPWGYVVDVFFMLSGFVLTGAYLRRQRTLRQMLIERVFRLLPVHLAVLCCMLPVYLATEPKPWPLMMADLAALSIYLGNEPWNGPAWSINIELYLPVVLFLTLGMAKAWPAQAKLAGLALFLLASCLLTRDLAGDALGPGVILRGIAGLGTGSFLYHVKALRSGSAGWRPPLFLLLLLFFGLLLLVGKLAAAAFLLPFAGVAMIWVGSEGGSVLGRGPFWFLGYVSYSLYMVHHAVLDLALYVLGGAALDGAIALKAALIAASVGLAWLLTLCVERPAMGLGRRLSSARQQALAG